MRRVRLRQVMKQLGWASADLAERLGVDPSTVRRYMSGKAVPPLARAMRIAVLTGTPVEEIWPDLDVEGLRRGRKDGVAP